MPPETKDVRERKDDDDGDGDGNGFTDLSHECRRFPFAFKPFREISPELHVEEDWPVTRLAYDIFYGYRVISAYFLCTH